MDLNNIKATKVAVYTDATVSLCIHIKKNEKRNMIFFSHGLQILLIDCSTSSS